MTTSRKLILGYIILALAAAAIAWAVDRDAKGAGFRSALERYAAAHAGYTDPQAYRAFRESEESRKAEIMRRFREQEEAKNAAASKR